ncbi:uncharacterized mitochondrial protein AtMg00860-like [Cryptomeria japonica]|uniref:uncharacterized mitochondrial protein AtMg00860-like n=1 Tax=Cryptomeria japonica TaxID=3369 RepID=UPI0027D9FEE7|nr:uncharacterized mitochondrial protein AtMg00860-like [Cryptomeria japonica]
MDDFTTYGTTFEEALQNLTKVLEWCEDHNLSLNSEKCFMMIQEGIVLAHIISRTGLQVDPAKIEVILAHPTPVKQKDVTSFLGHAGYYKRFFKDFSQKVGPLYSLLTKEAEFEWTVACEKSFSQLKETLTQALVLKRPDWSIPFHIHTDTSNFAIGAVLGQKQGVLENAIYYISKNLQGQELNYTGGRMKPWWSDSHGNMVGVWGRGSAKGSSNGHPRGRRSLWVSTVAVINVATHSGGPQAVHYGKP